MRYFSLILLSFIILGCAKKADISKQKSALIVWKSPTIRYADMGFISKSRQNLKIEIYQSGSAVMRLVIDKKRVCMGQFQCLSKREFNKTKLSQYYPDDLIENIFRGKPIFNGINLERVDGGFRQNIYLDNRYDIEYSVIGNKTIFRDRIGGVLIKITL
jgi:hypothetical protein